MLSTQHRPSTSAPSDGSRTVIVHDVQAKPEGDEDAAGPSVPEGTLRLRGGPRRHPRVAWDEGVVDNEDCGRKKSKSVFPRISDCFHILSQRSMLHLSQAQGVRRVLG